MNEDSEIEEAVAGLKKASSALSEYVSEIDRYVENEYRTLGYSLYEGAVSQGKLDEPYFLENVIENNGSYLHPNAVRYLLIKIKDELVKRKEGLQASVKDNKSKLESFIAHPWKSLEDEEGTSLEEYRPKSPFGRKKKHIQKLVELKNGVASKQKTADTYLEESIQEKVYTHGIRYISELIEGFEAFYDAFESEVGELETRQEEIKSRYTQAPGMTVRYVAASRPALDALVKRYPYTGSLISVDADLSRRIVDKTFAYAKKTTKPNRSRYFGELFEDQILEHYQESANKKLNKELDNGILEAIELEADLLLSDEQKESRYAVDQYVRDVLDSTRNLSTPFIEKPSEINAAPIFACAFHPSLMPARGDESYQAKLVQEELVEKGGIADEDIDRNSILFYQSYYGLRANTLSKFSPPKNTETYRRNGGEYFNAYSELVGGIHPNSRLSQEISPHIDRRWHLAAKMPDLDEGNQIIEEYGINAAFFWLLVLDFLKYSVESNGQGVFGLETILMEMDSNAGDLLVDEHKRASRLPEVLQALAMQPSYVRIIRDLARNRIEQNIDQVKTVEKSDIYLRMHDIKTWFDPQWIGLPANKEEGKHSVSFFEIPLIMKASTPVGTITNKKLSDLLQVMLKEAASYIAGFCSPEEVSGKIRNFVDVEYRRFGQKLLEIEKEDSENGRKILLDDLITDELETAAMFLKENGVYDLSAELIEASKKMKN